MVRTRACPGTDQQTRVGQHSACLFPIEYVESSCQYRPRRKLHTASRLNRTEHLKLIPCHIGFDQSLLDLKPGQTTRGISYTTCVQNCDPESVGDGIVLQRIIVELPAVNSHFDNILLVKCNPPNGNDIQSQWISAMQTTEAHLSAAYKDRPLYFILAVGLQWLPFYWDPTDPRPAGQGLKMRAGVECGGKNASGWYFVMLEVRAPPGVDAGHVDADGVVRTDRARSLDCVTVAEPLMAGEMPGLANQVDLDFLEEFLGVVERNSVVDGSKWDGV